LKYPILARENTKLVTFDVRLSNTAGRSNEWIPLKPGTDGIVALAMAQHILQQGLHDKEFLSRWTNVPLPKLAEHLAPYTPEQAEKVSEVKAADIKRVAIEFAKAKPAVVLAGRGISGHVNGVQSERCIALLNAVVGSIDVPGGCCLHCERGHRREQAGRRFLRLSVGTGLEMEDSSRKDRTATLDVSAERTPVSRAFQELSHRG
jgi:anaerobic selenocysteine-containing dehydrogenase